jgi:SAM-dependent methyltransferase
LQPPTARTEWRALPTAGFRGSRRHGLSFRPVKPGDPTATFIGHTIESLHAGTFVRLVLSRPVAAAGPKKILGRAIKLRGAMQLSLTQHHSTRDLTENIPVEQTADWLRARLGTEFRSALLGTTTRDWQLISAESGPVRLVDHRPAATRPPTREHDQKKTGWLDASARDWLTGLELLDRDGQVRASKADKYRQINSYLEIISHLVRDCGWTSPAPTSAALHFADMGCGKGYLTFGLWQLFARTWQRPVRVTGVEARAGLVTDTNQLARRIQATGLEFVRGEIATAPLADVDALIALHACNTATDDAIRRGVALGAKLIVVAPCCHQELRPQLGRPEPFAAVLAHGIMAERLAEWTTDGLRALFLEWAGYRTKIMEFIGGEHTPKNLMIAAIREREPFINDDARQRIIALKEFLQLRHHALDAWLESAP